MHANTTEEGSRAITNSEDGAGGHATDRWARMIVAVAVCRYDPTTLHAWAGFLGASRGTIRTWCYAARLSPKASLDFARLLRAVIQSQGHRWDLQEMLDIVNQRTVRSLLARAGLSHIDPQGVPPEVEVFLERQRLIRRRAAVDAVTALLTATSRDRERSSSTGHTSAVGLRRF